MLLDCDDDAYQIAAGNAGLRSQFRFAVHAGWPRAPELGSLDHIERDEQMNTKDISPVHHREYSEPLDLRGRDFISLLGRPKEDVVNLVGKIAAKDDMQTKALPDEFVTSMTGQVADEIHEWPKATLGPRFRHLVLQFRDGRFIDMMWKFKTGAPLGSSKLNKPWWRFW